MVSLAPLSAGVPRVRVVALGSEEPSGLRASSVPSANDALAEREQGNAVSPVAEEVPHDGRASVTVSPPPSLSASAAPVGRSPGRPRSPSASGPPSLGREVIRIGARATRAAGRTERGAA